MRIHWSKSLALRYFLVWWD
uniref:Uncharacterized protein n=1 Tax=Rhizophora mucronata TaxID=61149 RepID=A0A2P2QRW6_RHIMU